MTDQPSAEALEIADGQPLDEVLRRWLARDIDAVVEQRVAAERERVAKWHDHQAEGVAGIEGHTPAAFAQVHRDCADIIREGLDAPAEHPAPKEPAMTEQPLRACPRARSNMTPCVIRDGELALSDRYVCIGCGVHEKFIFDTHPRSRP